MIHHVFAVHDAKAEAYLPPFLMPKVGQATRVFADCVNSPDHQFSANPEDYTLFQLGDFDVEKGEFLLLRAKQSLGNGVEFLRQDVRDKEVPHGAHQGNEPPVGNGSQVFSGSSGEDSEV